MLVDRIKFDDGTLFVLNYIDVPDNRRTVVPLDCKTPLADQYKWKVYAKSGAPHAGHTDLGVPRVNNLLEPWLVELSHSEYPWPISVAVCRATYMDNLLVTRAWVIAKMKSSTDIPYHPTICGYDEAECVGKKFDCAWISSGKYDGMDGNKGDLIYFGEFDRDETGTVCQPWYSERPNNVGPWGTWHRNKYYGSKPMLWPQSDIYSGHNFCRLVQYEEFSKPYCIRGAKESSRSHMSRSCDVLFCHQCMFGLGNGTFPGEPFNGYWVYPILMSDSRWTTNPTMSAKGKKTYTKCFQGDDKKWKDNTCKVLSEVGGRSLLGDLGQDAYKFVGALACLAETTPRGGDEDKEDEYRSSLKWVACKAPQCTVRQIWFMFVPMSLATFDMAFLKGTNNEPTILSVLSGATTTIKFYHFGTNKCSGMSVVGEESVQGYAETFELKCKPTPQMSEIVIAKPSEKMSGIYEIKYVFEEGDPIIEKVDYRAKFHLEVREATSISIQPVEMCPNYPGIVKLDVSGSFRLTRSSIDWQYSPDDDEWTDVDEQSHLHLSSDGLQLTIDRLTHDLWVRVQARSRSGRPLDASTKVTLKESPKLYIPKSSFEAKDRETVKMAVKCNPDATVTWIFRDDKGIPTVIDSGNDNRFESFHEVGDDGKKTEKLMIKSFGSQLEGIYTVEVKENGCASTGKIFVSMIK